MRPLAALLLALAVLLPGCGSTSHSAPQDASSELEAQIRQQLPGEAKRLTGSRAFVSDVGCVHGGGNAYQCIATVSGANAYSGTYESTQLSIDGTCDQRQCIWKVAP